MGPIQRLGIGALLCLGLSGCPNISQMGQLVEALNDRGVNGCYEINKQAAIGYPPGGVSGSFRGIIGSGGNTVPECVSALAGRGVSGNVRLKQCQGEQCTDVEIR